MLKIAIALWAVARHIAAENDDLGSGSEHIFGETWVEVAAKNASLQARAYEVRDMIERDMANDEATILKPYYEVDDLSTKTKTHLMDTGMTQLEAEEMLYECRTPESHRVGEGLQNISYTRSCVTEIVVGRLLMPSGMDWERILGPQLELDGILEQIDACEDQECTDPLEREADRIVASIPPWPGHVSEVIKVFPYDYEDLVDGCVKKYKFRSIRDTMVAEIEKRRKCFEKLIKDHPTWNQRFMQGYNNVIEYVINLWS